MSNQTNNGSGANVPQNVGGPASVPYASSQPGYGNMPGNQVPMQGGVPSGATHIGSIPTNSIPPMRGGGIPGTPNGGNPGGKSGKSKRPIIIGVIVAVIVVIAVICGVIFGLGNNSFFDSQAQEGQAPYKSQEEIQAELNRVVEEGMLSISIASYIELEDGTSPGTAYIENVPSNRYVLKVTITLDSNGEVVYQSGGIRPDSYIETITLSEDLPAGTYPATATFVAYDPDSLEEVGQAAAKITLSVLN